MSHRGRSPIGPALLAGLAILSAGCAGPSAGLPSWARAPEQDGEYIRVVGIGRARSLPEAQKIASVHAGEQLVRYFGFEGSSRGQLVRTDVESTVTEEFRQRTGDTRIEGALVEKWEQRQDGDEIVVYALVRYPREAEAVERWRQQEERQRSSAEVAGALARGEEAAQRGALLDALAAFAEASALAPGDPNETFAVRRFEEVLSCLHISAASGADQAGTALSGLPEPLTARVSDCGSGRAIPNVPLTFIFNADGRELVTGLTDADGVARASVDRLDPKTRSGSVIARIDYPRLLGPADTLAVLAGAIERAGKTAAVFPYELRRPERDLRVLVLIDERIGDFVPRRSTVGDALEQALVAEGFPVVADVEVGKTNLERIRAFLNADDLVSLRSELRDKIDAIAWGQVEAGPARHAGYGMFESWIGGSIKVISVERGEITAIVDRSGLRGVDLSGPAAQAHGLREFGALTSEELARRLGELDSRGVE